MLGIFGDIEERKSCVVIRVPVAPCITLSCPISPSDIVMLSRSCVSCFRTVPGVSPGVIVTLFAVSMCIKVFVGVGAAGVV